MNIEEMIFDDTGSYRRVRTVREEAVDDKLFLIDREEAAIHMLEPVGQAVWRLLLEPVSIDEVTDILHRAFPDTDRAQIRDDVEAIFIELDSYRLIAPAD